ncbi:acyl carrier protein phosphodiesterase [Spartinivicinus ruber]|uniref:acyl carrier protein phosphodiesterase n=1 Tax=Spartinivicinus ruber TaxID=2683272 RepID=UPI0013CFF700|nr:ACP phosphodiesterase [Spartinivicinus ruber]
MSVNSMNYLAHLYLAQPDQGFSLLGNLMGDFCKGVVLTQLPVPIQRGIKNHRAVDQITDNHPIIRDLKRLFEQRFRRFAGIITDVAFDYFLIKHWSVFSQIPLTNFIEHAYVELWAHRQWMPVQMQGIVGRMIEQNWLQSYQSLDGVGFALARMSKRIRFENPLAETKGQLIKNYDELEQGFLHFFPLLIKEINELAIESLEIPITSKVN